MTNLKTCFIYSGPHDVHAAWAKSLDASFYSFVPFNSRFFKRNGLLIHASAFLKALFFLPWSDVYFLESPIMITAALTRTIFSKRKKVFSINSDPFLWRFPKFNPFVRFVFGRLMQRIDGYVSTSELMDSFAQKTGKPSQVVHVSVQQKYFDVTADLTSKNVCFIGPDLGPFKGADILIDVFKKLPDQKNRELYLVGDVIGQEIQDKVDQSENIHVTGRVHDPRIYLKKCGLYLNLARLEPAGINILEAMAAGIPPIVSVNCGNASIAKRVDTRLVVPLEKEKIVKTVVWLEKSGKKKALGKKARSIAREYSMKNSVLEFKEKFSKLLTNSSF